MAFFSSRRHEDPGEEHAGARRPRPAQNGTWTAAHGSTTTRLRPPLPAGAPLSGKLKAWSQSLHLDSHISSLQKHATQTATDVWGLTQGLLQKIKAWQKQEECLPEVEQGAEQHQQRQQDGGGAERDVPAPRAHSALQQARKIERQVLGAISQLPGSLPSMPKKLKFWRQGGDQNLLPVTMPPARTGALAGRWRLVGVPCCVGSCRFIRWRFIR
jgi:hypothetical protein